MKTTKISKELLKDLRDKLNPIIAQELSKLGISGELGNATFSEFNATVKLNLRIETEESKASNNNRFIEIANLYYDINLIPEDFSKDFNYKNKKYKLIEVSTKSRTYPFIMKCEDNKITKFSKGLFNTLTK